MADALVSGSSEAIHVGSSPVVRTNKRGATLVVVSFFVYPCRRLGISSAARRYIIKGGAPPLYLITRQRASACDLMIYSSENEIYSFSDG